MTQVEIEGLVGYFLCVSPGPDARGIESQLRSIYNSLFQTLEYCGASPVDLIAEKLFFSKVDPQFSRLKEIRQDAYAGAGHRPAATPAVTFLHQPPCYPGRLCELHVFAVSAADSTPVQVTSIPYLPGPTSGRIVETESQRHIYLSGFEGTDDSESSVPFVEQAERMFERAEEHLRRLGASFQDVVRTWIYIADIEQNYEAFNPVRTSFFNRAGIQRIPASTGIQGGIIAPNVECLMDIYALQADPSVSISLMRVPTMNEAPSYGSAFSRGIAVSRSGKTVALLSGTASIDEEGEVVHRGNIEGQVGRMLQNVEALLRSRGATTNDLVSAHTYLKRPEFQDAFGRVWDARGCCHSIPHTVTVADICRPEWLWEIEVAAIFPDPV